MVCQRGELMSLRGSTRGALGVYVEKRYLRGFRALRPGREDLVMFAAIAGVPTELIKGDVDLDDAAEREQLYNTILSDSRMQEKVEPNREIGEGRLVSSCSRPVEGASAPQTASHHAGWSSSRACSARMVLCNRSVRTISLPVTDALVDRIANICPRDVQTLTLVERR